MKRYTFRFLLSVLVVRIVESRIARKKERERLVDMNEVPSAVL